MDEDLIEELIKRIEELEKRVADLEEGWDPDLPEYDPTEELEACGT